MKQIKEAVKKALIVCMCAVHVFGWIVIIVLAVHCTPWFLAALLFYVPLEIFIYRLNRNDWDHW